MQAVKGYDLYLLPFLSSKKDLPPSLKDWNVEKLYAPPAPEANMIVNGFTLKRNKWSLKTDNAQNFRTPKASATPKFLKKKKDKQYMCMDREQCLLLVFCYRL